jgi:histidinol dehydrogenase
MIQIITRTMEGDKIEKILSRSQIDSKEVLQRVDEIVQDVKVNGNQALLKYTEMFDQNNLKELKVTKEEIEAAKKNIDVNLKNALENAI